MKCLKTRTITQVSLWSVAEYKNNKSYLNFGAFSYRHSKNVFCQFILMVCDSTEFSKSFVSSLKLRSNKNVMSALFAYFVATLTRKLTIIDLLTVSSLQQFL
jgi:hypothetical protein